MACSSPAGTASPARRSVSRTTTRSRWARSEPEAFDARASAAPPWPADPTPTARRHSSKTSRTSASQNSTRRGRRLGPLVARRSTTRSIPLKTTLSGTPCAAQPLTRANAGPTTRTR